MSPDQVLALWSPDDGVTTVLVVTAHPDDVDFGAAGTVGALTDKGIKVVYCIVTDGEAGGSDLTMSRSDMAAIRRREQTTAANAVGVDELHFLGYPDGAVTASLELRRDITRVIRVVRPQRVITQSPDRYWDRIFASHPDHLAAGESAICAVYPDSRNPFAHPELLEVEGLEPHTVDEVWLMADPGATIAVDTTTTFDRKMTALCSHESQIQDPAGLRTRIEAWSQGTAAEAGLPNGSYAESFRVVHTV